MTTTTSSVIQGASAVPATSKDSNSQLASLYVGDLNKDVTEAVLYELFNAIGPVASIRVCRDSVTKRSLGYAYVNFHQSADADRAIEALNYTDIKGTACRIMWVHRDPASRRNIASNVYIKNLDKSIDNRSLYDTFSVFGNVLSCKISTDSEGKSRGFAFVHYETAEAATAAIEKCNGMQLGEKTLFVGHFSKTSDRPHLEKPFSNIYVKHIPVSWDEETLHAEFAKFGEVTSAKLTIDSKQRRFGFVNFKEFDQAKAAIALHGKDMRTDEEKAATLTEEEKAELEASKEDGCYTYQLYVTRALTKEERSQELKQKFSSGDVSESGEVTAPAVPANTNLYIKNLSETLEDEELKKMFEPFGEITSCKIMKDDKGVSKAFGFVCYANADEATRAVTEMHLKLVNGKPLYVGLHERREQRLERLAQRYRLNPMMAGPGMMAGNPGLMMQQRPGVMAGQQYPGMYGQTGQPMYYNGMPGGPRGPVPQQGIMGQRAMAPQVAGAYQQPRPGMPAQMNPYMNQMGGAMGMNPQQQAMRAASGMIPGQQAGMRPNVQAGVAQMGMRPQPVGPGMRGPGAAQQYQFNNQARNQAGMSQQPQQGWPEPQAEMPLTAAALAAAPPAMQKQMLGEKLFPLITKYQPELAGKITGMMLEMDNSELLILLESEQQLRAKVEEAMRVLQGQ
jgi:polyadenylate-binding protein